MSNQTDWWAPERSDVPQEPAPSRARSSRERGSVAREKRRRRRRSFWVVAILLVVVLGAGYLVFSMLQNWSGGTASASPTDFPGPGHGSVTVVVNEGDSGAAIGATLADAGVVASAGVFADAYSANPDAVGIQPGTYQLLLGMPASDAVLSLLNPASKIESKVTIAEGLTAAQIVARVAEKTDIPEADLQAAIDAPDTIGLPAEAGGEVEGWLFPATYSVQPDETAVSLLSQMTAKTVQVLTEKGVAQDQWETVLNKASLIEREAKLDEDRPTMARAIENRLADNWTLGIDAAVRYGLAPGEELTKAALQDESNPFNLRVHTGLPPTPIASPGTASIDAVLHPADGDWMWWCTPSPDNGKTEFQVTEDEFLECKARYQDWAAENE
ncbi:endolytic transglycosylase MltG [Cellulomonas composti]|uniref:Endolytic murein transglycosylase n=1 Tax=Cellulomonas composti TaxID=266130 RepID=A0A511J7F6_9CELL|nr:endolytic transglycosylase MltG [Cellulomonas composti]GEL93639.1 ABC transporter substrate-binding protein [Cellulomonas composti]